MSLFNKIKTGFNAGKEELTNQVTKFKNRKFLEATIGICVGVGAASGGVSSEEKMKMLGFIKSSKELKVFDEKEVIEIFNQVMSSFDFDVQVGRGEVLKLLVKIKDSPEMLQLAVRVGIAVANSDNDFDQAERNYLIEVCKAVNLEPAAFSL